MTCGCPRAIMARLDLSNIAARSAILKMLGSSCVTTTNVIDFSSLSRSIKSSSADDVMGSSPARLVEEHDLGV